MIKLLKLYWLDILNYIYFRKVVAKYNKSEQWKRLNLRQNRIGEIYTVVRFRGFVLCKFPLVLWS